MSSRINGLHVRPFIASFVAVAMLFLLEGHSGLSLWDEGYLWYGSQRVAVGEIPIRDFMAYDPGRYYWSAAFISLLGDDGIISVRIAAYVFQGLGMWAVLAALTVDKPVHRESLTIAVATLLMLWMFPRHKLYDATLTLWLIAGLATWIRNPRTALSFALGVLVGLVACFGRNHGVYGLFASAAALLLIQGDTTHIYLRRATLFGLGVLTGYLPVLLMLVFCQGFSKPFFESILMLLQIKATNLPLPVPWPWVVGLSSPFPVAARDIVVGLHFVLLAVIPVAALAWCICKRGRLNDYRPVGVASALLALPYAHFAFSRADISHLAQGGVPALIGILLWLDSRRLRYISIPLLLVTGAIVMLPMHPGWQALREGWPRTIVAGEALYVSSASHAELLAIERLVNTYAGSHGSFVATPYWPGAYALMRRKSPMWEIYALVPRSEAAQLEEIRRIREAGPGLVFLLDFSIDGKPERRLSHTHPALYHHLTVDYVSLPPDPALNATRLFQKR